MPVVRPFVEYLQDENNGNQPKCHDYELEPEIQFPKLVNNFIEVAACIPLGEETTLVPNDIAVVLNNSCSKLIQNSAEFIVTFLETYNASSSHDFSPGKAAHLGIWLVIFNEADVCRFAMNLYMFHHDQLFYRLVMSIILSVPGFLLLRFLIQLHQKNETELLIAKALLMDFSLFNLLDEYKCSIGFIEEYKQVINWMKAGSFMVLYAIKMDVSLVLKIIELPGRERQKSVWMRKPEEITKEEYVAFYKSLTNDGKQFFVKNFSIEAQLKFEVICFVTKRSRCDRFDTRKKATNTKLHVRRDLRIKGSEGLIYENLNSMKNLVLLLFYDPNSLGNKINQMLKVRKSIDENILRTRFIGKFEEHEGSNILSTAFYMLLAKKFT